MNTDQILTILSPIITLIAGAILKHYTEKKSKIIWYLGHVSAFKVQSTPPMDVFAHSIIVLNAGNKAAKNVRIGHNVMPPNITVHPQIQYSIEKNPNNSSEIVLPTLVSKEAVTISYLYYPPLTYDNVNTYIKSDEGLAKKINIIPTQQYPKIVQWLVGISMFIGISVVLYWIMKIIIQFI
jgi:hypothetical protein